MKYVIVNGDDFGASHGINLGILEAHQRGILTSTSLMVDTPWSEEAALLSKATVTPEFAALREQVRAMVAQLGVVAKQIEAQLAENEANRQENAALLRELSQSGASQAS